MATTIAWELMSEGVRLKSNTLELIAKYFDAQRVDFAKKVVLVHRKSVFQILTRLIRVCPVDTGRLRGSWTPFMDKYNNGNYAKYLTVKGLAQGERKTEGKGFSDNAFKEGKNLGYFIDELLSSTIGSNVDYAEEVEARTSFLASVITWGERRYNDNFDNFIKAMVKAGVIPAVDPNEEGPTT